LEHYSEDLALAHIKALEYLVNNNPSDSFNCGYGHGYSVFEVIEMVKKISGVDFKVNIAPRRAGDPAQLVANNHKIVTQMGWKPYYDDLEKICKSAWEWEKNK
jgi:UDP-glucose 4-epimerase